MKKTAVDYLYEKLWGIPKDKFTWQMILKEAKISQENQIKKAYEAGFNNGFDCGIDGSYKKIIIVEKYIFKTYGEL
jgi:hypothetical protein